MKHGKAGILIVGIFIGMIIGIAMASWMDYMGYEMNPFHRISGLFSRAETDPGHPEINGINTPGATFEENPLLTSPGKAPGSSSDLIVEQSFPKPAIADSPAMPAQVRRSESTTEMIQVETDQLLESRLLPIEGERSGERKSLDSLLLDDRSQASNPDYIRVELWSSPINYKGYKWTNNRLSLFGLTEMDLLKIISFEGKTYLKYHENYFYLEPSSSFRNFRTVRDPLLIKHISSL